MRLLRLPLFLAAAGALFAQHSFTPGDVEDGERLFLGNCAICHGPDGNMVPGADLSHGTFRHTSTDEGLVGIIQKGIPGTAMPPHNLPQTRALTIVAFLRSMSAAGQSMTAPGDAAKGLAVFEGKGNCLNCHRVRDRGSRLGPDLTDIGANRRAVEMQKSILDPDAEILPQNRFMRVVTKDGAAVTGRLLNQDAFTIQMMDPQERLVLFQRANLKDSAFVDKSPMPSYKGRLTDTEVADVVSYLVSLKGINR